MENHELVERAIDGQVIGNGKKQIAALVERIEFLQARWDALQDVFGNGGSDELKKTAFDIIANGSKK